MRGFDAGTVVRARGPNSALEVHPGLEFGYAQHSHEVSDGTTRPTRAPRTGRDRLVAAAVELFYRNGFGAVGVDRVIAAAGVTKTTFYKHFDSKDELMVAAVQRRDEWESQAWDRAVRKLAGDDPAG